MVLKTSLGKFDRDPGYFVGSGFLFTFHSVIKVGLRIDINIQATTTTLTLAETCSARTPNIDRCLHGMVMWVWAAKEIKRNH